MHLNEGVMGTRPIHFTAARRWPFVMAVAAAWVAMAAPAAAQPANQTGRVETVVLRQLSFVRVDDLHFGQIIPGPTAGVVRVQPNGVRTATGGVTLAGSTHQAARFAGFGSFNQQVLISMGSNTIQLTGPGAPMTVSQWEIGSTPTAILTTTPTRFRITAANGIFSFPLGARLAVNANQAPGNYAGTFTITLNYQ